MLSVESLTLTLTLIFESHFILSRNLIYMYMSVPACRGDDLVVISMSLKVIKKSIQYVCCYTNNGASELTALINVSTLSRRPVLPSPYQHCGRSQVNVVDGAVLPLAPTGPPNLSCPFSGMFAELPGRHALLFIPPRVGDSMLCIT